MNEFEIGLLVIIIASALYLIWHFHSRTRKLQEEQQDQIRKDKEHYEILKSWTVDAKSAFDLQSCWEFYLSFRRRTNPPFPEEYISTLRSMILTRAYMMKVELSPEEQLT